ncbi:MAG: hypothetical protein ACRD9R_21965 [Pyrinomonadaceae bacterium]
MCSRTFYLISLLCMLAGVVACGGGSGARPQADARPEITAETIRRDINGERVEVPPSDGSPESPSWRFERHEPKEVSIIDQRLEGDTATIEIDMRTGSGPRAEKPKKLSGRLRLHYKLEKGWALRQWEIVALENLSFKYESNPPEVTSDKSKQ